MTEQERIQVDIEAWTMIRNDAWNSFLTAVKRLMALGVKQNICGFIQTLDKIRKSRYTE